MHDTTDICRTVIMMGLVLLSLPPRSALATTGQLTTNCPTYLREGIDLNCECYIDSDTDSKGLIIWDVPGSGSKLHVKNVQRNANGSKYTCSLDGGTTSSRQSVTYILHVIYGPTSVIMTSNATRPFVTDGTAQMSMFCQALGVYPAANYTWTGVTCVNENHTRGSCIFTPRVPEDNRREVSCTAYNVIDTRQKKSNNSRLYLVYPPTLPPEITRETATFTCTVKGGYPKVSSVTFFCGNESDRPDVVDYVSVSSSVVINVHQQHSHVTCECSATWDPQPGLYPHKVVIPLNLIGSSSSHKEKPQLIIPVFIGAASVVFLLIIVIVIACFIKKKRSRMSSFLYLSSLDSHFFLAILVVSFCCVNRFRNLSHSFLPFACGTSYPSTYL